MKNLPDRIYLQIDADGETPEDFKELGGVTWCTERIYPTDIEYILNGEIRESCGEFCNCQNPSIYVSVTGQTLCANCGKLYIQNSQERT